MKWLSLLNLMILLILSLNPAYAQKMVDHNKIWDDLSSSYDQYKYEPISHRRFKHTDVMNRLDLLDETFTIKTVGKSNEGRAIKLVSIGEGPVNVLLWSQMHGDETTATMALMDAFNWLGDDNNTKIKKELFSKLTIHIIPMLNPDGAQRFTRRNTQAIDINRDALRLQTPEGMTLKQVRDSLEADWGFNLHDQGRTTAVGSKPATISFLAPAYNVDRDVNEKREDAMQLIAAMNYQLQRVIPGQVGSYWDDFEPRAFGDNIQKWGTRTILIESGGNYQDREKQQIRKLNYLSIISSLIWIANGSFEKYSIDDYNAIPPNSRGMRDVILKNLQLPKASGGYLTDLAIDFTEVENHDYTGYYLKASVADVGDLSTSDGYLSYDLSTYEIALGKAYSEPFANMKDLISYGQKRLLEDGFTNVTVATPDYFEKNSYLMINRELESTINIGSNPSLLFYQDGELKFVLINGYLIDISKSEEDIIEGKMKL